MCLANFAFGDNTSPVENRLEETVSNAVVILTKHPSVTVFILKVHSVSLGCVCLGFKVISFVIESRDSRPSLRSGLSSQVSAISLACSYQMPCGHWCCG